MIRSTGLTLLECLIVIALIGLLAALGIPALAGAVRSTREGRAMANTRVLAAAQATFYARRQRFALPAELFASGCLPPGSFARPGTSSGATETLSDGVYDYSARYSLGATGITIDADPAAARAATHRRYRIRLGRAARGRAGGEGVLLVAPPSLASPPSSAYRVLGS